MYIIKTVSLKLIIRLMRATLSKHNKAQMKRLSSEQYYYYAMCIRFGTRRDVTFDAYAQHKF